MRIRWMYKSGNTAVVDGVAKLLSTDSTPEKFLLRQFGDNFFVMAVKHTNHVDMYAFSQYETKVLPSEVLAHFKLMAPKDIELVRPEKPKKERDFESYKK